MVLKKRYIRNIKESRSLYVSATLLTILSLAMFYLFYICGTGIKGFTEDFIATQKLEDANFSTYLDIPQEEIEKYEDKYNLTLEKQHFMNIRTDGITARIFEKTEKVDLYAVTVGRDVAENDEIVISEGYAQNCNVNIGDNIKIKDRNYKVVGYAERPDYLYMIENLTDSYKNVTSFYICYMTDEAFDSLGEKASQYLVRYSDDTDIKAFRKDINDNYLMAGYLASENNYRISMLVQQPEIFLQTAYIMLFTLPLIVVVLISIILSRKIKSEQKMIGTLSAYGYTNSQIIWHYAGFSAIPGVAGGILTTVVVALSADAYGSLGLMDYEPLKIDFKLDVFHMILGIVIPTVMYIISTVIAVNRLLKNDTTALLAGTAGGKSKTKKYLVGKNVSFRTKFGIRSIIGNPGRTFALFLGVFLGSFITLFGLADYDSLAHITDATTENMANYDYQYMLNELSKENTYGGETLLAVSAEDKSGNVLSVFGTDNNKMLGLKDMKGNKVTIDDGYYISSLYAFVTGAEKGDKLTVINPLSMEEFEIEVSGIVDNNFAKAIYTTNENTSRISGIDADFFNVVMSKEKLDIPEKKIVTTISKEGIDAQYKAVFDQMNVMIYVIIGLGMFICIAAVYISVNMAVTENRANISMLRVLGYNDKRIGKLLLNDNIYVVIIAILLSLPVTYYVVDFQMSAFIDVVGYLIQPYIKISSALIGIAIVLLSYVIAKAWVSRKIAKVDMVESLKDNRE